MDTLNKVIRRTVEEAVARGSVIGISEEVQRLAALYAGEAPNIAEIAAALTREALRSGDGVRIGEPAAGPAADDGAGPRNSVTNA